MTASPTQSDSPPAKSVAGTDCPPDPEPKLRQRPAGEQPFVEVIPDEEIPLTRSKSKAPVRFGKVVCKANENVWRDVDGHVRVCTVAQRATVDGIDIAAGAYSRFHADGKPSQTHIARPQTLRTAKGEPIPCAAALVVLSKSGALEHCQLARPITLGKVACRKGESVAFHHGGELAGAVLDRPLELLGVELTAGTRLAFHPSGALAGGWLRDETRVLGVLIRWDFSIFESGKLHVFELAEKHAFQGHEFPKRAKLELREDGSLRYAKYEVDSGFMPHGELWNDTKHVSFDCHGSVISEHVEHWQADSPPPSMRRKWK